MEAQPKNLLEELERLADAAEKGNFNISLQIDGLPDEERQAARLFDRILKQYQARAAEENARQEQIRDEQHEAEQRIQLMLDTSPFSWTMWNRKLQPIACSLRTVSLFGFADKQEFFAQHARCLPERQPNGRHSLDMLSEAMLRTFEAGANHLEEWTQITANGELGIFDLLFVRVQYKDDYVLLIYARDIRKDRAVQTELARRDDMLAAQAHWYKSLLDATPLPLSVTNTDMELSFVNTAATALFGKTREELLGKPCSCWQIPICGTRDCSIARAKLGCMQTSFTHNGASYTVHTEILRDMAGETSGFIEIIHDVTEIEKTARQQADEANEAKSIFLATMSHEMRTPLNAVIGLSEVTLDSGGLNEETEANLEKIYNAGSTLLSIVNDILDLSKIKSGKFEIVPYEYDVPSMLNDSVTQNLMRMGSKPIRFVLDIDADMPTRLYGDDLRVKQIISNLLSNAFKYTEKGLVELGLSCTREGETVWMTIRVRDTGLGIRQEYLEHLFSDYTQFDTQANRKVGGTGLGLSITKNLAELAGGHVAVASTYGEGSVFTVTLRQGFVNDARIGEDVAQKLKTFRYAACKRDRHARINRILLPYARVLVVDDHPTNLDVAKGLMKPYGMHIDCVTSGQEAVRAVREEKIRYHAIFMDHMMPGMDGMEATRRIRGIGTEYARAVPIIALTANAIVGSEERFLRNGFNAFISKPIDMAHLDKVLRNFVRNRDHEGPSAQAGQEANQDRRRKQDRRTGERRVVARRNSASLLSPIRIDGLDIAKGLEAFGDEESYLHVLRSYATHTRSLLDSISTVEQERLADYAILVHGIKGSSRGIYAEPAGRLAEALEHAARSEDWHFVQENNPGFLACMEKLLSGMETLLADRQNNSRRPKKDRPDSALLAQLQKACDMYDLEGIDAVMRKIEGYEYTADDGLVAWLREATARLDYAQIVAKITQGNRSR